MTLGTDHPSWGEWFTPFSAAREMYAYSASGIPNYQILKIATINSARAMGFGDRLGIDRGWKVGGSRRAARQPAARHQACSRIPRVVIKAGRIYDPAALLKSAEGKIGPASAADTAVWAPTPRTGEGTSSPLRRSALVVLLERPLRDVDLNRDDHVALHRIGIEHARRGGAEKRRGAPSSVSRPQERRRESHGMPQKSARPLIRHFRHIQIRRGEHPSLMGERQDSRTASNPRRSLPSPARARWYRRGQSGCVDAATTSDAMHDH